MKILIASDFHANLEAFESFLRFVSEFKSLKMVFLGDYVGYNPDPETVVSGIRNLEKTGVLIGRVKGNHDIAVIDPIMCNRFNANAKRAILWTVKNTSADTKEWLSSLPDMIKIKPNLLFCHGSLRNPNEYIFNEDIAYENFLAMPKNIKCLFFGHTHIPVIYEYIRDENKLNTYWMDDEAEFQLKANAKYLINPGSIGQPRNGDNRLSFIIFDNAEQIVRYYKIHYNYIKTQKKIYQSGLPEFNALRLEEGC